MFTEWVMNPRDLLTVWVNRGMKCYPPRRYGKQQCPDIDVCPVHTNVSFIWVCVIMFCYFDQFFPEIIHKMSSPLIFLLNSLVLDYTGCACPGHILVLFVLFCLSYQHSCVGDLSIPVKKCAKNTNKSILLQFVWKLLKRNHVVSFFSNKSLLPIFS